MSAALDITAPAALIEASLTLHLGEIHLRPLDTSIVVRALVAALCSALNLWRIGAREDREKCLLGALRGTPNHGKEAVWIPRTPWYQLLGAKLAATKVISPAKQESLLSALVAAPTGVRC